MHAVYSLLLISFFLFPPQSNVIYHPQDDTYIIVDPITLDYLSSLPRSIIPSSHAPTLKLANGHYIVFFINYSTVFDIYANCFKDAYDKSSNPSGLYLSLILCYDADSDTLIWALPFPDYISSSDEILVYDDTLVVMSGPFFLHVRIPTGNIVLPVSYFPGAYRSPPYFDEEYLYFVDSRGNLIRYAMQQLVKEPYTLTYKIFEIVESLPFLGDRRTYILPAEEGFAFITEEGQIYKSGKLINKVDANNIHSVIYGNIVGEVYLITYKSVILLKDLQEVERKSAELISVMGYKYVCEELYIWDIDKAYNYSKGCEVYSGYDLVDINENGIVIEEDGELKIL